MTLPEFFGCSMIAFGPPLALFIFTIAKNPIRVIILVVAAFFWLLSLLTSSLFWYVVTPLRSILAFGTVFSVLFQEYFRYLLYLLLRKFEEGLEAVADDRRLLDNKHILAYVSGFGFGIISAMFALVNVLADLVSCNGFEINTSSSFILFAGWSRDVGFKWWNRRFLYGFCCPGAIYMFVTCLLGCNIL